MTSIYVGNLPYSATEESLSQLFSSHGEVSRANIIMDRETGRSRGFGFVEMSDASAAQAAIEGLNGAEMDGRTLVVNEARPKADRPHGGGGGRY